MDRLNLSEIGGFPLRQDRLLFMQNSIIKTFENIGRAHQVFLTMDAGTGQPLFGNAYVLHGCVITDNGDGTLSVTSGAIFQENEVFDVFAHTIAKSTSGNVVYHFNQEILDDAEGIREYANGVSHPTQKHHRAKLAFTNYATSVEALAAFLSISATKVTVSTNGWTRASFYDTYGPWKRTTNRQNGWQLSHSGTINLFYHRDRRVQVLCNALPISDTPPVNEVFATLPVGYRPTADRKFFIGVFNGFRVYVVYEATGAVRFVDNTDTPTSELLQQSFELNHWFEV